jgi:ferredoxin--NADP+ reductase
MRLQDYNTSTRFPAAVVENQRLTPARSAREVREITLDVTDPEFRIVAGQHVGVIAPGQREFGQRHHLRLYSIADVPQETRPGVWRIHLCVERCYYIDDVSGERFPGRASNYLCDLQPGDPLTLTGPYASAFNLPTQNDANLILIAAGTGIAPFRALVKQLYATSPGFQGRVLLFQGGPRGVDLLYRNEVNDDFSRYYDRDTFEAFSALSRRPHWSDAIDWDSVFESRSEQLWTMLLDPKTYVYLAGLESLRNELDAGFARLAESAKMWEERKEQLEAEGRWAELLY